MPHRTLILNRMLSGLKTNYMRRLACLLAFAACVACSAAPSKSSPKSVREVPVHFFNRDVRLAGTLVLPTTPGPHAAVVLLHGSGPQKRDLFMARWFAEQGVAALAYDKRGVGESAGDFTQVPFMWLAEDGLAAIAFLHTRPDIDRHKIGVWGLSQGGWLGPLAAARSSDVAFVISVSGPGVSPGEQMIFYYANELRSRGMSENDVQAVSILRREVWASLHSGEGMDQARADLARSRNAPWYNQVKDQQDSLFERLQTPADWEKARSSLWFQKEMGYDPVPILQSVAVPALFIFGAEDRLVPVKDSVDAIKGVSAADKEGFTIVVFPHADHTLHLVTAEGRGALSPEYLQQMQEWLGRHVLLTK
ncbi:MAG TPA: alpha/beta fold hydrolase [Candidatus Angelobacter sp.]